MNPKLRLSLFMAAAGGASIALSACLSTTQQAAAKKTVEVMEQSGLFKPEVIESLRSGLESAAFTSMWQQAIGTVVSIGLTYLGVRVGRGPSATVAERVARRVARQSLRG